MTAPGAVQACALGSSSSRVVAARDSRERLIVQPGCSPQAAQRIVPLP
jgi:hypothetical protein